MLLLLFWFFGLSYMEPKPEDGIVINFGQVAEAGGEEFLPTEQAEEAQPEEAVTETQEAVEEVLTQETTDAPAVTTQKKEKPKEEKPKEDPKPKVDSKLSDALKGIKNNPASGEGPNTGAGDQGDPNGDPTSKSYTGGGGGGAGGNGNYLLGNRRALSTPKPDYNCPEQGKVVVAIYVNRQGKVVQAIPGERIPGGASTTTTSSCLFDKAKAAALSTNWQGDPDAPDLQKGYIIYNFQKQ